MINIRPTNKDWEHDNSSLGRPMLANHWPTLGNHLVLQARLMHDLYTQYQWRSQGLPGWASRPPGGPK